jgi:hypothetical protein
MSEASSGEKKHPDVQVGWRSRKTGELCECPVYESSPHANSDPVMVPWDVWVRSQAVRSGLALMPRTGGGSDAAT